ncbi:hypothetical protein [Sulfuritalea sp.]|uniref:hypothetical protein n=1 Tax=Sulfuritalea sp. TaxID=2480090 RepID=UPI001ACC14E1|nr:hypothetical protein [Sulfuritalea sp.]MBN8475349.1 hypothetical protein [Sulfuritalea sp.]
MTSPHVLIAVGLAALALPAAGASVSCPDLAQAAQIAACPAEEELRYTFDGFCASDARAYKGDTDVCTDYQSYRRLKNVALWESVDGAFSAYVSCDRSPAEVKAARVSSLRLARQGKINLVICGYGEGLNFTLRTRAECRLDGGGVMCATDAAACKATCD